MRIYTTRKEAENLIEFLKANNLYDKYSPDYALVEFDAGCTEFKFIHDIDENYEEVRYYVWSISALLNMLPPRIPIKDDIDAKLCIIESNRIGYYREFQKGTLMPYMTIEKEFETNDSLIANIIEFIKYFFTNYTLKEYNYG